jgi:hypothetical protein
MKKPICLLLEDCKAELVSVINRYQKEGVPCYLLEPITKDLHGQVAAVKADEIAAIKRNYLTDLEREAKEAAEAEKNVESEVDEHGD